MHFSLRKHFNFLNYSLRLLSIFIWKLFLIYKTRKTVYYIFLISTTQHLKKLKFIPFASELLNEVNTTNKYYFYLLIFTPVLCPDRHISSCNLLFTPNIILEISPLDLYRPSSFTSHCYLVYMCKYFTT